MAEHPTELLESYALHLLTPSTQVGVAEHLGGCPTCRDHLRDIERTLGFLAYTAPLAQPPEGAEQRLFERVARLGAGERRPASGEPSPASAESDVSTSRPRRSVVRITRPETWPVRAVYAVAGLAAVLVLVVGILGASLGAAHSDNEQLQAQVRQQQFALSILGKRNALVRHLGATEREAGAANGTLAIDPASGAGVVLLSQLPVLPAGKTYEFWVVQDIRGSQHATPTAAFTPANDGTALIRFSMTGPASAMYNAGVSIEEAGRPPSPHSPMILLVQA